MIGKTDWNVRKETLKYNTNAYTITQLKAIYQFIFLELPSGGSGKKDSKKYRAHKDNRELLSRRIMQHLQKIYTTEFPTAGMNEKNVYSLSLEALVRRKRANGEAIWPKLYEHSFKKATRKILKLKYDVVKDQKQWAMLMGDILGTLNGRYKKRLTYVDIYAKKEDLRKVIENMFYSDNVPLKKRKFSLQWKCEPHHSAFSVLKKLEGKGGQYI